MRRMLAAGIAAAITSVALVPAPAAAAENCAGAPLPAGVQCGLTNVGFESGFDGWTQGTVVDEVAVTGADQFTSPQEGSFMARLGRARTSSSENQTPGSNEIVQEFVVDQAKETFLFNVFTYDYQGYDRLFFELTLTNPSTGQVLAQYEQGAFGSGVSLKTTGWQGITLDLANQIGKTVRLSLSAGGTSDDLFGFWAYIDAGDKGAPALKAPLVTTSIGSGSTTTNPVTGVVNVNMPVGNKTDIAFSSTPACDDGSTPTNVSALLAYPGGGFTTVPFDPSKSASGGTYHWLLQSSSISEGTLVLQANCPGGVSTTPVATITLYDPSGIITDASTGQPVQGATVTLYKVPGWSAKTSPTDTAPNTCQSNLSKSAGTAWNQPAPAGGQVVPAADPGISPNVNPQSTNNVGYYGWDVAAGCYYVTVTKDGYQPLTSPVVGVPPEVTDLDLVLTPIAASGPKCAGYESDPRPQIVGTAGKDTLNGTGAAEIICGLGEGDIIKGGAGADLILGGDGVDYLVGGIGDDVILGGTGNDQLVGDEGADQLLGEAGNDILDGKAGADVVNGGIHTDRCTTTSEDTVLNCP